MLSVYIIAGELLLHPLAASTKLRLQIECLHTTERKVAMFFSLVNEYRFKTILIEERAARRVSSYVIVFTASNSLCPL